MEVLQMKKFLHIILLVSCVIGSMPVNIVAYGPRASYWSIFTEMLPAWTSVNNSSDNINSDDRDNSSNEQQSNESQNGQQADEVVNEEIINDVESVNEHPEEYNIENDNDILGNLSNQPVTLQSKIKAWYQNVKGYGKSCGRWIGQNSGRSLMVAGGCAALGILGLSKKSRAFTTNMLNQGKKLLFGYAPKMKSILTHKPFLYGAGLLTGGAAMYAYRESIKNSPFNMVNSMVDSAVDRATGRLQHNLTHNSELAQTLRLQGQNLGRGITEGAVARLDDEAIQSDIINSGRDILGRAGRQVRSNRWLQGATALVTFYNVYNIAKPLFA
jgi:hypothetical protein